MARSFLVFALIALFPAVVGGQPVPGPDATPAGTPATPKSQVQGPGSNDWRPKKDRDPKHDQKREAYGPRDRDHDHDHDPDHRPPPKDDGPAGPFKKRLEQMSPEEREHFQENWKRWKQMGDGERKDWQQRAMDERERIRKIIDDTISNLGLNLDQDQRQVFVLRYRQERRKIEEALRKEFDDKRTREVDAMLQRLKTEFSTPKPAPTATPDASPTR